MHRTDRILYCANPLCQASNPVSHRFCQNCRSPLVKRYLWLVGTPSVVYQPGDLLFDRYNCVQDRVFLDTKPGLLPEFPEEISSTVESYLRLFGNTPHIPQVFAVLPHPQSDRAELYLLENAPIYPVSLQDGAKLATEGALMPAITTLWRTSSGLRQLNWLWQLAQLWDPLHQEEVVQSLLIPDLIRVEGGLIRLLELSTSEATPALADLGALWQQWLPQAQPEVANFLTQLCQQLIDRQIQTSEHLIAVLEQAISICAQAYQYQIQVATLTDQGPTRQRNEDACFPASGSLLSFVPGYRSSPTSTELPVAIVCDGIGGHEGGDVASHLAISTMQQKLQSLSNIAPIDANTLTQILEEATLAANDAITQRNDIEQRHERQRMGTTLVMALAHCHELYLTHIGDSRAYRITSTGCHQVTLDDDLAAREVRLGYSLYREALRQPSAGSLVQALGMNASNLLRPTVRRFGLDEDCIFLLCSDGLSDNDRVEEVWQSDILPTLNGSLDLKTAVQRLVAIANQQNGHDNVTVALVHCRVTVKPAGAVIVPASLAAQTDFDQANTVLHSAATLPKTQDLNVLKQSHRRPSLLTIFAIAIGLGGLATYFLIQGISLFEQSQDPQVLTPVPTSPSVPSVSPPTTPNSQALTLAIGTRVLVNRSTPVGEGIAPISLLPSPLPTVDPGMARSGVGVGSVLEVIDERQDGANQRWLRVKVCSMGAASSENPTGDRPRATAGDLGWVEEAAIAPLVTANVSLNLAQLGICGSERKTDTRQSPNSSQ